MNDQTQGSTTTSSAPPLPTIIQKAKQAFNSAPGPLSTKEVMQRPWFRENNVTGPTAGRAFSALVRAHDIHKVREGVYAKGAGPQSATGIPASSSTQARNGNGAMGAPSTSTQPKKAGSQSKSQTKRMAAQKRPLGVSGHAPGATSRQRQQSAKGQRSTLGASARKTAQNRASSLSTTSQNLDRILSGPQTGQGAMVQRIQQLEASNRTLTMQLQKVCNTLYGKTTM